MRLGGLPKNVWKLLKESFAEWNRDKALRLGASLSFYTMLSLPSLLVILVAVAAVIFGREVAQARILEQFGGLVGEQGREAIQAMLTGEEKASKGTLAKIFAGALLLFGATGVFAELQDSLNIIWDVKTKPRGGLWGLIRTRVLSLNLVLAVGFLLIVSLVISAALAALGEYWGRRLEGFDLAIRIVDFVLSFAVLTGLFAILFRRLPDIRIPWRDVWLGAGVTSFLFTVGKIGIGAYLGRSAVGASYGSAGPLVVLLLWTYYSSLIFFFGAEFTQVYSRTYGSRMGKPAEALGEHPARAAVHAKTAAEANSPAAAQRTSSVAPMPVPRMDLARERLRVSLSEPATPPARSPSNWGRLVFGGGLIATALILAARLIRR